jgi:hypothetical protein
VITTPPTMIVFIAYPVHQLSQFVFKDKKHL